MISGIKLALITVMSCLCQHSPRRVSHLFSHNHILPHVPWATKTQICHKVPHGLFWKWFGQEVSDVVFTGDVNRCKLPLFNLLLYKVVANVNVLCPLVASVCFGHINSSVVVNEQSNRLLL